MKIDRQALIFGVLILAIIGVVAGFLWFTSLFESSGEGAPSPVESFFSSLFPFGSSVRPTPPDGSSEEEGAGPTPTLRQVTANPGGGFLFYTKDSLRYVERETGHIFETPVDSYKTARISNSTLPGIFNTVWLSPNSFVMQYLGTANTIRNFFAELASSTPNQALSGRFLETGVEIYPTPDGREMLRVARGGAGILVDRVSIVSGASETLFSSSLRSWRVLTAGEQLFVMTSHSSTDGFLYRVLPDQSLARVLGSTRNLSAIVHPSGRYIAYSAGTSLAVIDLQDGRTYPTSAATFADKCTWASGSEPVLFCGVPSSPAVSLEGWYMGVQTLNDSAWIIDPIRQTVRLASNLELDAGRAIDVWKPSVSPDGAYAAFMDKGDLSLWLLKLP